MDKIMFHINSLIRAGAERVISNLAGQFAEHGYEAILATEWFDDHEYELNPKVKRIHVGLADEDEKKSRLTKAVLRVTNLSQAIKQEQPDIIVAFTRKPIYRALMATYTMKIPIIISVRCNPVGSYDTKSSKLMIKTLFPKVSGAVFQTTQIRDFFPANIKEKATIIWNPISDKFLQESKRENTKKEIVCINRFANYKNQLMLAEAFCRVYENHTDYTLCFYGEDSGDGEKTAVENYIKEKNAQDYIKIMKNTNQVEQILAEAAVFVLSSKEEGQPNVLMEAMAMGLPVISTDCLGGGPRDLIQNEKNGLLIQNDDRDAMAKAIICLIEDREYAESLGREARKIKDMANSHVIFEEWEKYIQTILGKR